MTGASGAVLISFALLAGTPGLAAAEPTRPDPNSIASLIAAVADANQQLQDIGAAVQTRQESVNKAIVDVQTARDDAETAKLDVEASKRAVADATTAIAEAQKRFNSFAAASYMQGPSSSYLTAKDPGEVIAAASTSKVLSDSSQKTVANLQRARTEQVNKESVARAAQQKADQSVLDAQRSQDAAVAALTSAQREFGTQQQEITRLEGRRADAQNRLNAARPWATPAPGAPAPTPGPVAAPTGDRWDPAAPPSTAAVRPAGKVWDEQWDPTLPKVPSAFVSGDPIAIINSVLGISATSTQVTSNLGRNFLQSIGILKPTDTGITNGRIPRVYGRQAAEYVIRRAASQMGVPYSWGGGNAAGPSRGIDSGAGTVGFDCSGLVLYAFAGVGIKLPHYSGSQYDMGRKIPSSQMRRGDVIFYGPGGSQHVTIYLGNGQMIEAPYTGSHVKVSPVRTSGMTPYVIRYIEY